MQNKASQGLDSILTFLWSEEGLYWFKSDTDLPLN